MAGIHCAAMIKIKEMLSSWRALQLQMRAIPPSPFPFLLEPSSVSSLKDDRM